MMLVVTVAYGVLIALLAMFGVGGIGVVAIVGGIIVGLGWALTGVLAKRDPTT